MEKVLELINVCKKFNNAYVLENVNFSIFKNDIFGFLGPNGAGKTTTIRLILDLLKLTYGEILINGSKHNEYNIRKDIGFCLDNDGLYENMSAKDNLEFFDRIYNPNYKRVERINNILEKVKLKDVSNKKVLEFSKGMKKRLGIARALLVNPKILILDEPLLGLDPEGQSLLKNIIKDLSNTITIFFSSHNLNDVESICNRIAILNKKIMICDSIENLKDTKNRKLLIKLNNSKPDILKIYNLLISINGVNNIIIENNFLKIFFSNKVDVNTIISNIMKNNGKIEHIQEKDISLEEIYFNTLEGEKK
ncbi:ABC transporter ATP-binding protein [Clostridium tyrobutyricum]|uniref:ABC transporter ATP-binding protein n=1 Tax=Clostridium tyrobutyricum TaxID=1519 RepID=UPI001C382195|nr:ABC transporter ATP-binding protein [Clostridium tyrobutyricum]MBV4431673.1 ABC transporter ATP-binding protein [Clostridium tyrobutyricum]